MKAHKAVRGEESCEDKGGKGSGGGVGKEGRVDGGGLFMYNQKSVNSVSV